MQKGISGLTILIVIFTLAFTSCLSPNFANQISAKEDYPGEYFEDDTFSVTIKNDIFHQVEK